MTLRPRIAVFGSVHMDLIGHATELPEKGTSRLAHDFTSSLGGKGGNQACECAAAGAKTYMVTRLGDDAFGQQLLTTLRNRNVDCSTIDMVGHLRTGTSTVLSAPEGYTSLIYPGAAATLTPQDVRDRIRSVGSLDIVIVQLEVPTELSLAAAKMAREMGARVVVNASPYTECSALLDATDVVVVNESEALQLTGTADAAAASKALRKTVVVTLGAAGSEAGDGKDRWFQPAEKLNVKSSVGAGDAFLAGLCVSLCQSSDIQLALKNAAERAAMRIRANDVSDNDVA